MIFIGVGNENRGDDAAGLYFVRELRRANEKLSVFEISGDTTKLLDVLTPDEEIILVDAMMSGLPPGTVQELNDRAFASARGTIGYSTHSLPLPDVLSLAELTGKTPAKWIVYGIEGKTFEQGAELSPEVREAADRLVDLWKESGSEPM